MSMETPPKESKIPPLEPHKNLKPDGKNRHPRRAPKTTKHEQITVALEILKKKNVKKWWEDNE